MTRFPAAAADPPNPTRPAHFAPYDPDLLGARGGFGCRPAILVVDLINGFTDPAYPPAAELDEVVANTRALLDIARELGHPVIFTAVAFSSDGVEGSVWRRKMPALDCLRESTPAVEVDARLGRRPGEPVVVKRAASAFFGTGLATILTSAGVDSVMLTGATTSGCVRASVIDSCSAGFPTVVPASCVGDRHPGAHEANLFDIDAKYADVVDHETAVEQLSRASTPSASADTGLRPGVGTSRSGIAR